jgi:REP element-mobilizing transposase RayT
MLEHPKRYYGLNDLHFLTFSCYKRQPLLGTPHTRTIFVNTLATIRERYKFLLAGYVVMPEHVHMLISESPKASPSLVRSKVSDRSVYPSWGVPRSQIDPFTLAGCPRRRFCVWV